MQPQNEMIISLLQAALYAALTTAPSWQRLRDR